MVRSPHNTTRETTMNSYIVRIYRQDKDKPRLLVGVVEEVGVKGKKAFTNLDELWGILSPSAGQDVPAEEKEAKSGEKFRKEN